MDTNKRIINTFEISIDKPKMEILKAIEDGKKNSNWSDFLYEPNIDYREFKVYDSQIEITRKPTFLSGYRPFGTINIEVRENENGKSQLVGKILIPKDALLIQIVFIAVFLSLWILINLIISTNIFTIISTFTGLLIFGLIIFLSHKFNNWKLIDYSKRVMLELNKKKVASY